ncbi:MAG: ASKHA domain-containing protein, partial [Lachnospiraceae bacterium]|nr:ASKHA domain-containing protein [Lachnospiraceae bacterium]
MKYKVHFIKENCSYEAEEGMRLLDAAIAAGITPDAPCGGMGKCGKCRMIVNGREVLACQTTVKEELYVSICTEEKENIKILRTGLGRAVPCVPGLLPGDVAEPLLAAVDLGSTSVVGYLLDGKSGELLGVQSMLNPQSQFGADVVVRSSYAMEHGADKLSHCIREAVDSLLGRLAESCGHRKEDIVRVVMAGNSCMHHLFLEIPVDTLVMAPYVPKVKEAVSRPASDCGIRIHPQGTVYWLPNIGGFVGADTTACILAAEFDEREELTLMIDIGTNGEMVLGNRDGYSACSTAAGPAFEGAKITCGMRGSTGAIDHVQWTDGKLAYHVIGEGEPLGICGSGLLDAVACLLRTGQIEESGRMEETCYFTPEVYLNQKDIRELQLAKAAIAAGIQLLCRQRGVRPEEIRKVLLAGAFGNYLDPKSACRIGMIPAVLQDRIVPVGNLAGQGAQIAALCAEEYERSRRLASRAEFLELALNPGFQDVFV